MKIEYDFHNHTNVSRCAQESATVESIIRGLEPMGFTAVGLCDHLYRDTDIEQYLLRMRSDIARYDTTMQVYLGVEVDMCIPGKLDADEKQLTDFDYRAVACPHYQNERTLLPLSRDYRVMAQNALDYFLSAASIPFIDIIVHPFDVRGLTRYCSNFSLTELMACLSESDYRHIIELLSQHNIAIELTERLRHDEYFAALQPFLRQCAVSGVRFSLGSDSHAPAHLGSIRKAAKAIACLGINERQLWRPMADNTTIC